MCNYCNWSNRSSCGCGCGCNQNGLFNTLFGSTQRVCRDCCGNLVVKNNNSCGCGYSCGCGCGCGCGCNNTASTYPSSNGNGYACVSYCQRTNGNATSLSGNGSYYNGSSNGQCGCNAYSAWTQENYGE
ncbi:MAG: hypothetical protein E7368_04435 [Clostridiales bacterium]|nr:hypothetical protein [Clostridiales bacterium]